MWPYPFGFKPVNLDSLNFRHTGTQMRKRDGQNIHTMNTKLRNVESRNEMRVTRRDTFGVSILGVDTSWIIATALKDGNRNGNVENDDEYNGNGRTILPVPETKRVVQDGRHCSSTRVRPFGLAPWIE